MYLLFIWGGTYGFGWGEIHNEGRLKEVGPESRDFFGPLNGSERRSAICRIISSPIPSFASLIILESSVADPGCLSRIPDLDFFPSRIRDPTSHKM